MIILTPFLDTRKKCLQMGMNDILAKPMTGETLKQLVDSNRRASNLVKRNTSSIPSILLENNALPQASPMPLTAGERDLSNHHQNKFMQFLQINVDANNLPSDGPVSSSINPLSSGDAIAAHADNNMP